MIVTFPFAQASPVMQLFKFKRDTQRTYWLEQEWFPFPKNRRVGVKRARNLKKRRNEETFATDTHVLLSPLDLQQLSVNDSSSGLYFSARHMALKLATRATTCAAQGIHCLAVYGTLRDDDDSGAPWTRAFITGVAATPYTARVDGFVMFQQPSVSWPFAVPQEGGSIVVRVLDFGEAIDSKIDEADHIEVTHFVDNEQDLHQSEYLRVVVDAQCDHQPPVRCFMYVANQPIQPDWKPIESGDWLQRDRDL